MTMRFDPPTTQHLFGVIADVWSARLVMSSSAAAESWTYGQQIDLFDRIRRGLPVRRLYTWTGPADAQSAEADPTELVVVDGRQVDWLVGGGWMVSALSSAFLPKGVPTDRHNRPPKMCDLRAWAEGDGQIPLYYNHGHQRFFHHREHLYNDLGPQFMPTSTFFSPPRLDDYLKELSSSATAHLVKAAETMAYDFRDYLMVRCRLHGDSFVQVNQIVDKIG